MIQPTFNFKLTCEVSNKNKSCQLIFIYGQSTTNNLSSLHFVTTPYLVDSGNLMGRLNKIKKGPKTE